MPLRKIVVNLHKLEIEDAKSHKTGKELLKSIYCDQYLCKIFYLLIELVLIIVSVLLQTQSLLKYLDIIYDLSVIYF